MVLRHTLMNPFLLDAGGAGGGYIRGYFDHLERLVAAALAPAAGRPVDATRGTAVPGWSATGA